MCFIFVGVLCSCVTPDIAKKPDPAVYWKRDLEIQVGDYSGKGILVVPKEETYRIKVKPPGDKDLVVMRTCHREEESESVGYFDKLNFAPVAGLEDTGMCFLELAVFDQQGKHAWAMVDIENKNFTLPHRVKCNGQDYNSNGTTICQAKEGLIQEIIFPEEVIFSDRSKCKRLAANGLKTIRFEMPNRECTFIVKGSSGRLAKLSLIGYEKLLLRDL